MRSVAKLCANTHRPQVACPVRQCAAYNAIIPRGTIQARHLSGYFVSFSALICGMSCTITPHNRRRGCRMVHGGQVRVNAPTPMQWWTDDLPQCHHCYESPCCEASAEQMLHQNGASAGGSVSEAGGCAKGGQLSACYLISFQDRISNEMESCVMMPAARKSAAPVPLDSFASDRSLAAPFHFLHKPCSQEGRSIRSARELRISRGIGGATPSPRKPLCSLLNRSAAPNEAALAPVQRPKRPLCTSIATSPSVSSAVAHSRPLHGSVAQRPAPPRALASAFWRSRALAAAVSGGFKHFRTQQCAGSPRAPCAQAGPSGSQAASYGAAAAAK